MAVRQEAPSIAEIFALFELLLGSSPFRVKEGARPVVFRLVPCGERWMLDPRARGSLFRRLSADAVEPSVLRLSCSADVLIRLVVDGRFTLGDQDLASFEGNIDDLLVVAEGLAEGGRALNLRSSRG